MLAVRRHKALDLRRTALTDWGHVCAKGGRGAPRRRALMYAVMITHVMPVRVQHPHGHCVGFFREICAFKIVPGPIWCPLHA